MDEENNNISSFKDLDGAVRFLINNKGIQRQNVDKVKLKDALEFFSKTSVTYGLSSETIKTLCTTIIFDDAYDIPIKRKLLYACVPLSADFPYQVIPLAVSSISLPNVSSTWQHSVLTWLSGLLEFHIIEESNRYVHICYPTFFILLENIRLCGVICKILYQITKLEDVTPCRTKLLLHLERKNGFRGCVSRLIRIYKFFRPDLIVSRLDFVGRFPSVPKGYQESLSNARARFEEVEIGAVDSQDVWGLSDAKKAKLNPYHEPEVVPLPEILLYAENIEEKKERKISVLQYKRIKDMIKDLPYWKDWRWPNSAPTLLQKPILISLFKPYDPYVKVAITNWLELALRTEIVEQLGNPNVFRQESLLDACIHLVKQCETLVPAVFHFLMEYLDQWDLYSHMPKLLELLAFFPFISPIMFFESVFEKISHVLTTVSLPTFCAFVRALANMILTWALQAQTERDHYRSATDWPFDVCDMAPLEGIYILTQRLERVFLGGLVRFGPHSLLLNAWISYYSKVNMCCAELSLPLFVVPPAELLFAVLTSGDVVATHRLGFLFTSLQTRVTFLKEYKGQGDEKVMCAVALSSVEKINFSLMIYLDTTVSALGFVDRWKEKLACYVGEKFYESLTSMPNVNFFGVVCRAPQYLPLSVEYHETQDMQNKEQRNVSTNKILTKLKSYNLNGIHVCARTYIKEI